MTLPIYTILYIRMRRLKWQKVIIRLSENVFSQCIISQYLLKTSGINHRNGTDEFSSKRPSPVVKQDTTKYNTTPKTATKTHKSTFTASQKAKVASAAVLPVHDGVKERMLTVQRAAKLRFLFYQSNTAILCPNHRRAH